MMGRGSFFSGGIDGIFVGASDGAEGNVGIGVGVTRGELELELPAVELWSAEAGHRMLWWGLNVGLRGVWSALDDPYLAGSWMISKEFMK